MRLPGTWEVWQASFQNDRRFWLFDPCNLESWRKIAADWDPAHFQPGGGIFGSWEEAKPGHQARNASEKACLTTYTSTSILEGQNEQRADRHA